ncbi:MAG: MBL fold metallo-hydrolase [Nocardioides sp.]
MRLTVIGCAGSFPGPNSPASCYLVEADAGGKTWRILLDLGNGAFGALQRHVDPRLIDAVFLSHLHPDHCLDMCGYYVYRKYHPAGAQPAIPVCGPSGVAHRLARAYDLPMVPGMTAEFAFEEYDAQPISVGPFTVTPVPVVHPVPAYGLRVEAGGRVLAYSGDTGPCKGLFTVASGAHLLLAEASFRSTDVNPPDVHLTGVDCGLLAHAQRVGQLVITHVPAWHDVATAVAEARSAYAGRVVAAASGQVFEV